MKKIIWFIALVWLPIFAIAQEKTVISVLDSVALTSDTVDLAVMKNNYGWTLGIETWSLNAADATVSIYVSDQAAGPFTLYDSNAAMTLTTTTGLTAFEDDKFLWKYMRIVIAAGSVTSGDIEIRLTRFRRQ